MDLKLLKPLSFLFRMLIFLRRKWYAFTRSWRQKIPIPVIVIGNITLGGTGKTPLLISLAQDLCSQGLKVGVVSRGYKGSGPFPCLVKDQGPEVVGDEPFLIARKTGCLVVVDPNRVRAIQTLLKTAPVDVILSDDGLQHYAMDRAFEIAVVDAKQAWGNGLCLPAGPLREPPSRLEEVDCVVVNGAEMSASFKLGKKVKRRFFMRYQPDQLIPLSADNTVHWSMLEALHVIAGIGNPERFLDTIRSHFAQRGWRLPLLIPHFFKDHHVFSAQDFEWMTKNDGVLMTEKDAVKVMRLSLPKEQVTRMGFLTIRAEMDPSFFEIIRNTIL